MKKTVYKNIPFMIAFRNQPSQVSKRPNMARVPNLKNEEVIMEFMEMLIHRQALDRIQMELFFPDIKVK